MIEPVRTLTCFIWASALALPGLAAERIPGTQVTLAAPEHFMASADFAGYSNEQTGASLMVTEITGPYAEVMKGMTAEGMKTKGIELISREAVKVGGVEGTLLHTSQAAHGDVYHKWLLVFGADKTVMIHGTAPKDEFEKISDTLRTSMLAVKWEPDLKVGILEGLPFTMEEAGDVKFAFKVANGVALTRDGIHPQREVEKPLVVVTVVNNPAFKAGADQKAYAEALLQQTANIPDNTEITESKPAQIGGKPAHYIAATGKPDEAKEPIHYEITVLVEEGRLCQVFGRCGTKSKDEYQAVFETLRKSVKLE